MPRTFFRSLLPVSLLLTFLAAATAPATQPAAPLHLFANLAAGKKQTVITYGTSLTAITAWPKGLQAWFDKNFPNQVTVLNTAVSGVTSDFGLKNLQTRVLDHHPDLVFLEFSINDAVPFFHVPLEKSIANLDAMVTAIRKQNPNADIIIQIMNPVWDTPQQPGKTAAHDRPDYAAYNDAWRKYAADHHLPLIDHWPAWQKLEHDDPAQFHKDLPDGTHPTPDASRAVTLPIIESFLDHARNARVKP
ncbi:MAG TPA: SGNH/GDSL hydrolase family protein [Phycisphaerae bacterium]|nr:SGNH/GDSL hydrolase family protein [Phycisphaerae bacterium]